MTAATLTSKGQITLPAAVRQSLDLATGDRVTFVRDEHGGYAIRPHTHSVKSLKGCVPRPAQPVSLEDMQAAIIAGATA